MKGWVKVLAIVALVALPVIGVYFLAGSKWKNETLPFYDRNGVIEGADPSTIHKIGDFEFTDQYGNKVTPADFDTCIVVANIFFATCPQICPQMNTNLQVVAEKFRGATKGSSPVRFLSISIDPEHDSVPVLKEYAKRFKADKLDWQFVTGSKKEIYDFALNDLLLATEQRGNDFIHDDKVVIIDKEGHIRGILEMRGEGTKASDWEKVNRIIDDINNLIYEYRTKAMDKR